MSTHCGMFLSMDVAKIGVETSMVIVGMALASETSYDSMAREISHLTKLVTQLQNKLEDADKQNHESK